MGIIKYMTSTISAVSNKFDWISSPTCYLQAIFFFSIIQLANEEWKTNERTIERISKWEYLGEIFSKALKLAGEWGDLLLQRWDNLPGLLQLGSLLFKQIVKLRVHDIRKQYGVFQRLDLLPLFQAQIFQFIHLQYKPIIIIISQFYLIRIFLKNKNKKINEKNK